MLRILILLIPFMTQTGCKWNQSVYQEPVSVEPVAVEAPAPSRPLIVPEYLKPGDTVAIVAPGYGVEKKVLDKALKAIESHGLVPVTGDWLTIVPADKNPFPGTAEQRYSDLLKAVRAPEVKAIICERGGYGTIQLLDATLVRALKDNPKWIVGFSDITNLLAVQGNIGIAGIHGNMCSALGAPYEEKRSLSNEKMFDLLFGKVPSYEIGPNEFNSQGVARGTLVGGNLVTFLALEGTPYSIFSGDDLILFIEETGETMRSLDRIFNTLRLQGHLSKLKGIVFGEFYKCGEDLRYDSVEEMISQYTAGLGIPVCFGFPAGHGEMNQPFLTGVPVELSVSAAGSRLVFFPEE